MPESRDDLDATITGFLRRDDLNPAQRDELTLLLLKKLSNRVDMLENRKLTEDPEYKRLKNLLHGAWGAATVFFGVLIWLISNGYLVAK